MATPFYHWLKRALHFLSTACVCRSSHRAKVADADSDKGKSRVDACRIVDAPASFKIGHVEMFWFPRFKK